MKKQGPVWLIILAALVLAGGGTYVALRNTPGFRNNNPGNLRWTQAFVWEGQIGQDPKGFVIFDTMENGVRAMTKNLRTYFKNGFDTVYKIISRYAPGHENPTDAYVMFVANRLKVDPNATLSEGRIPDLVREIVFFENGGGLAAEVLAEGIRRAYV